MSLERVIEEAIRKVSRDKCTMSTALGTIKSVDRDKLHCTVSRDGMPDLIEVRLKPSMLKDGSSIMIWPRVGAPVLVGFIENSPVDSFIVSVDEVDEVSLMIDKTSVKITAEGIIFNEGKLGGLVILPELKAQLEIMTKRIDFIIDVLKNSITACSSSPNPGWKATAEFLFSTLMKEDYKDIENKAIKQ